MPILLLLIWVVSSAFCELIGKHEASLSILMQMSVEYWLFSFIYAMQIKEIWDVFGSNDWMPVRSVLSNMIRILGFKVGSFVLSYWLLNMFISWRTNSVKIYANVDLKVDFYVLCSGVDWVFDFCWWKWHHLEEACLCCNEIGLSKMGNLALILHHHLSCPVPGHTWCWDVLSIQWWTLWLFLCFWIVCEPPFVDFSHKDLLGIWKGWKWKGNIGIGVSSTFWFSFCSE